MDSTDQHSRKELRRFGILVGAVLLVIGYRHRAWEGWCWSAWAIASLSFGLSLFAPQVLRLPYRGWMVFGKSLGNIVSRVLLTLLFFTLVTPLALVRRVFNRDPLELSWDSRRRSYFRPKQAQSPEHFTRLF